mmetsp:Transcript_25200/g.37713  ORF Transcript_25200/g.37713 Transcript_25200/m.37713 type:complete len:624 (-) Transcript_25200:312-2183(-)
MASRSSAIFLNSSDAKACMDDNNPITDTVTNTDTCTNSSPRTVKKATISPSTAAKVSSPKREALEKKRTDTTNAFGDLSSHSKKMKEDNKSVQGVVVGDINQDHDLQQNKNDTQSTTASAGPSSAITASSAEGFSDEKSSSNSQQNGKRSRPRTQSEDLKDQEGEGVKDNDSDCPPVPKKMRYDTEEEDGNQKQQVSTPEMTSFRVDEEEEKGDEGKEISPQKHNATSKEASIFASTKKGSSLGRRGDPRMHKAVAARLTRPELTPFQALVIGGFKFPDHVNEVSIKYSDQPIYDSDGVLLSQRKNQLSRRLRHVRRRCDKGRAQEAAGAVVNGQDNSLYFTDPKQCPLLRDQLQNIMYKTKMAINDPVAKRRSKMGNAKNGTITCTNDNHDNHEHNDNYNGGAGSSNNNGGDNTMSSVHQLPQTQQPLAVPSSAFTMLNHHQQVNSFQQQHQQQQQQQQQQHLHMLNELVKQHQLQEQLSLYASAATQPHLSLHDTSSSLGFDPSYYGLGSVGLGGIGSFGGVSALGPIANNFMQAPSIFPNVPTSNFTNEMLYNSSASIYKEPPRMNPAAAPFPLSLSLLNQQQEQDMKRRALVEAGFKEHEIDESLLEAMNAFHHNPFQH